MLVICLVLRIVKLDIIPDDTADWVVYLETSLELLVFPGVNDMIM